MTEPKKTIKAVAIVRDIRAGMADAALRDKYRLTEKGLQTVFLKLLDTGLIAPSDLELRPHVHAERIIDQPIRLLDRKKLDFALEIYEYDNPDVRGIVVDISERGVGIRGMDAGVGDVKTFVIAADDLFQIDPVMFEAVCRWVGGEDLTRGSFGGYELTDPSETGLRDLLDLINALSMDKRTLMATRTRRNGDHLL